MRIRALLLCVLMCVPGLMKADTLSRAEAVAIALSANPDVLRGREELKSLEGRVTEAKADALPDVSATGMAFRYVDPSFLNSPSFDDFPAEFRSALKPRAANSFDGGFEVRQTLYSFKLGKAIRAARLARTLGDADLQRVKQQIALDTVQAYNQLLFATEQVRVAHASLESREKHLETTRSRRAAGAAKPIDVLRAEVDVENQRAEMTRAEGRVELARAQLNALMMRPMDAPITPTDKLDFAPFEYTLDDVMQEALANRPDLRVAELTEGVRKELVGVAKAETKPSVEFTAKYGRSTREAENFLDPDYSRWNTAVTVKIPIFNGRRTAGQVAQAEAEVGKARQDRAALQNKVRLQAMDAFVRLNTAGRLISAAELNVQQAKKALEMTQANYKYGAATILDVTDSENALVQAEKNLIQALHEHANARATLRFVMGREPVEGK